MVPHASKTWPSGTLRSARTATWIQAQVQLPLIAACLALHHWYQQRGNRAKESAQQQETKQQHQPRNISRWWRRKFHRNTNSSGSCIQEYKQQWFVHPGIQTAVVSACRPHERRSLLNRSVLNGPPEPPPAQLQLRFTQTDACLSTALHASAHH